MELQWTHKDSLFPTVTVHPHERESQTQTFASQNAFHCEYKKKLVDLTGLVTLFFSFTHSLFSFLQNPNFALSSVKRLLLGDTEHLL